MADQSATFAIELNAEGGSTENLAQALADMRQSLKSGQGEVREMEAALKRLQAAGGTNTQTFKDLRDQITAKKASLGAMQEKYIQLGGTFESVSGEASDGVQGLLQSLVPAGGVVGSLAGRAKAAMDAIGKAGLAGAFALGAVLAVAFAAAIVGGVAALASYALGAASAARQQRLLAEAQTGSAAGAKALGDAVDAAAGKAALGRDKLDGMAMALAKGGLEGNALRSALSASAVAAATLGDQAGGALETIAKKSQEAGNFVADALSLKGSGVDFADVAGALSAQLGMSFAQAEQAIKSGRVSVEQGLSALDAAVSKKLGKVARAQLLDFSFQLTRAKENVGRLFSDIKIEGFLEGLSQVTGLLDQNTASGRALKTIAETALSPLFDALGGKGGVARDFFRGMVIGALTITVAVLKVRNAINDAFGGDATSGIDGMKMAIDLGVGAFYVLAAVVGVVAGLFYGLYVVFVRPFVALYEVITQASGAFGGLTGAFQAAYDFIAGLDFGQLASDLIDGLVQGVQSGAGQVVAAFQNMAQQAMASIKSTLGIASPSKVFAAYGKFTAEGFAEGVEGEGATVDAAMRGMVSVPTDLPAAESGAASVQQGAALSRGGDTFHVEVNGVKGAEELNDETLLEGLVRVVRKVTASQGVSPEPVPG